MEHDLADQILNTSEKRLARLLLQLAKLHGQDRPEAVMPRISQETLAEMVGTTRSRVSAFINRFRRLGLIDYTDDVLKVRSKLLNVILNDGATPLPNLTDVRPSARTERYSTAGHLSA